MKHTSIDRMTDFEFHDAELTLISHSSERLVVSARYLNSHKGTSQNQHSSDMEIERAVVTFHRFLIKTFDPGSTWKQDAEGNWFEHEAGCVFTGEEALEKFLCELRKWINIFHFERNEDGSYSIDASSSDEPWFEITFAFDSIRIEWDEYRKIAWYEEHKRTKT